MCETPILTYPNFSKPFLLDTDASNYGIGAVLSQLDDDGREQVVAYASRSLSKAERKYCVTRRELLAVVVFVKHFRPYLLGHHFMLRTDHGSLTWLFNFREPEGQLARWLESLQELDFEVVHRKGKLHGNADALSRIPCTQCGRQEIMPSEAIAIVGATSLSSIEQENLRKLQMEDSLLGPIIQAKLVSVKPSQQEQRKCSRAS